MYHLRRVFKGDQFTVVPWGKRHIGKGSLIENSVLMNVSSENAMSSV